MSRNHSADKPDRQVDSQAESSAATAGAEAAARAATETSPPASTLEAELAEVKDRLLRALAEQQNIRQRARRESQDAVKFAAADFGRDLLATADNLRRAIESAPATAEGDAIQRWLSGLGAIERGLLDTFERHGFHRIDPLGDAFDPNRHQAISTVPDATHPAGTVIEVVQPGYMYNDRLLRPALVGVSKEPDATEKSASGRQQPASAE